MSESSVQDLEWKKVQRNFVRNLQSGAPIWWKMLTRCSMLSNQIAKTLQLLVSRNGNVSCSADRNIKGKKITKRRIFLRTIETNPAQYLPKQLSFRPAVEMELSNQYQKFGRVAGSNILSKLVLKLNGTLIISKVCAKNQNY